VIRIVVMMYVRFPLSLRNVEDLLFERGIDICHKTVWHWRNRFGPVFAADIRRQRVSRMRGFAVPPGGVVAIPPGVAHFAWSEEETVVHVHGEGPWLPPA
jgi:hypothetical protein